MHKCNHQGAHQDAASRLADLTQIVISVCGCDQLTGFLRLERDRIGKLPMRTSLLFFSAYHWALGLHVFEHSQIVGLLYLRGEKGKKACQSSALFSPRNIGYVP